MSINKNIDFDVPNELAPNTSTFSAQPSGLKAIYLIGKQLKIDVKRWVLPFQLLPIDSPGTMIAYLPPEKYSDTEKDIIAEWLGNGGRFIVIGNETWFEAYSDQSFLEMNEDIELYNVSDVINNNGLKKKEEKTLSLLADLFYGHDSIYFDDYHNGIKDKRSFSVLFLSFIRYPWGQFCLSGLVALMVGLFGYRLRMDRYRYNQNESLTTHQQHYPSRIDSLTSLFRYIDSYELSSDIARNYHKFKGN
ncbi:MAG: DUF4350 domain-containing protein [Parachlamydiaceae bacterium]|nr:DUF4350 domain-containing protein [Parachlamydiaceae bacterium]